MNHVRVRAKELREVPPESVDEHLSIGRELRQGPRVAESAHGRALGVVERDEVILAARHHESPVSGFSGPDRGVERVQLFDPAVRVRYPPVDRDHLLQAPGRR